MGNFITNSGEVDLKSRLNLIIRESRELKFLVGFFYFSGINEIFDSLEANPQVKLRILVGMNVDMTNFGLLETFHLGDKSSDEVTSEYFESLKQGLLDPRLDTPRFYHQVKYLLEMVKNGNLVIRKTHSPNHSKLYLFNLSETQIVKNRMFITGSSNLTSPGLSTQGEFNVEISDYGYNEAEEYFDNLWNDSVEITEYAAARTELIRILTKETHMREVSPFEAFLLVSKKYLESFEQREVSENLESLLTKNNYVPYKYQIDAVRQGLSILESKNGLIIADVVGLGKSIIACSIASELKQRGIVICPPGLVGDKERSVGWRKYLEEFNLHDWEVWSSGDLERANEFVNKVEGFQVVIVDEAHRFRNQDTQAYELLKNICRGKKVVLLTATPFNNSPSDILSLLKLFTTPKDSELSIENNLVIQFSHFRGVFDRLAFIKKYWNSSDPQKKSKSLIYFNSFFGEEQFDLKLLSQRTKTLANQIRQVIEPVTIRRNRLDLLNNPDYSKEVTELSTVSDPIEWFFALTPGQSSFYSKVISEFFGDPDSGGRFKGAIYRPFHYEQENLASNQEGENRHFTQQQNLFDFMRRLMVKRFESSFGSFRKSIENFKHITETSLDFVEKHGVYLLDRKLMEKIYSLDHEEIEIELQKYEESILRGFMPKNHKRYVIASFSRSLEFISDIKSDIKLFDEILMELDKLDLVNNDPKSVCLIQNTLDTLSQPVAKGEPKRKVVIFTEYSDTVSYLEEKLVGQFGDRVLVVKGNLSSSIISDISKNFDASSKHQEDKYDIVLCTDKLSEGFNLNRAGMVINFDIPWNPVRVIQRLGRINRISKKVFSELNIVNFFPTEFGASLVKSREIAMNKMFLIHAALGEDSKIFDIDELPSAAGLYQRILQNPDSIEVESFYTKVLREYKEAESLYPEVIESLESMPPRIKVAKLGQRDKLFVVYKKNQIFVYECTRDSEGLKTRVTTLEDVYEELRSNFDDPSLTWNSPEFWLMYESIENHREFKSTTMNDQSLEQRALNSTESLIRYFRDNDQNILAFLLDLKRDIIYYGTLPDYTLRRISNLTPDSIDLENLRNQLGSAYLKLEKRQKSPSVRETIIAIENKAVRE